VSLALLRAGHAKGADAGRVTRGALLDGIAHVPRVLYGPVNTGNPFKGLGDFGDLNNGDAVVLYLQLARHANRSDPGRKAGRWLAGPAESEAVPAADPCAVAVALTGCGLLPSSSASWPVVWRQRTGAAAQHPAAVWGSIPGNADRSCACPTGNS